MSPVTRFSIAALLALALPLPALGTVEEEVAPSAKVKGTISPSGEQERFEFEAPAGATLDISVSAKKKAALDFTLRVLAGKGELDLAGAKKFKDKDKKVLVKGLLLPDTGSYTLVVTAEGTGEYALSFKTTPRKIWKTTLDVTSGKSSSYEFAAPAGSKLVIKAKRAKKSAAQPHLLSLGESDIGDEGKLSARSHTYKTPEPTRKLADHDVEVGNDADADGAVSVTVIVKVANAKPQKLDVRGEDGDDGDDAVPPVASNTIPATNGGDVFTGNDAGAIGIAGVVIPGGAMAEDTLIEIAPDPDATLEDGATQIAAGPAVMFSPAGMQFSTPVTIVLSFDASRIPRGLTAADLRVLHITESGTEVLTPTRLQQAVLEVEASSFSTFIPFAPPGMPEIGGRRYWTAHMEAELVPGPGNQDSRERRMRFALGVAELNGGVTYERELREVVWNHPTVAAPPGLDELSGTVATNDTVEMDSGTWMYVNEFVDAQMDIGRPLDTVFTLSADGSTLVGGQVDGFNHGMQSLWLEQPDPRTDLRLLAGDWWIGRLTFTAAPVADGAADITFERRFGEMRITRGGEVRFDLDIGRNPWVPADEDFAEEHLTENPTGTWTAIETGRFTGGMQLDMGGTTAVMLPSHDLNVIVGALLPAPSGVVDWFVATRLNSDLEREELGGDYRTRALDMTPLDFAIDLDPNAGATANVRVPSMEVVTNSELRTFPQGSRFHFTDIGKYIITRTLPSGSVQVTGFQSIRDETKTYDLEPDGRYRVTATSLFVNEGTQGAIARNEHFGFGLFDPTYWRQIFGFEFFVRMPDPGP